MIPGFTTNPNTRNPVLEYFFYANLMTVPSHRLAHLGDSTEGTDNESRNGVIMTSRNTERMLGVKVIDDGAAINNQLSCFRALNIHILNGTIKLIKNFTYYFLNKILHGDHTVNATVFIQNNREMDRVSPKLCE
jgi:hypothetical protein